MAPPFDRLGNIRATAARIEQLVQQAEGRSLSYTEAIIRELHMLMSAGDPAVTTSDYRTGPMEVVHRYPDGRQVHILCPAASEVQARMARLVTWLNEAPMPVRAVEGFKNFLQTHPFEEGNGRSGRAVLALLLRESGHLRDQAAVEHFLFDYFERGGFKQRFGTMIEEIVVQSSSASWNEYFKELLDALQANDGHMPPIPGR